MSADLRGAQGLIIEVDCRIFHRAGVDGAHHREDGVEFLIDEEPPEHQDPNEVTLLLTRPEMTRLDPSYAALLDGMTVDAADPTSHPQVAEVRVRV